MSDEVAAKEFSPFDILGGEKATECPQCGAEISRTGQSCPECGATLLGGDDDEPLNLLEGPEKPSDPKSTIGSLRAAAAGIKAGTMTTEGYEKILAKVHYAAFVAIELFKTQTVKATMATLPKNELEPFVQMAQQSEVLLAGVTRMKAWVKTGDTADIDAGLQKCEEANDGLDDVQSKCHRILAAKKK